MDAPDRVGGAAGAPPVAGAQQSGDTREGFLLALSAYFLWGFLPFYLKAVSHIPTAEIVAHRVLWSVPIAGFVILMLGRTADLKTVLRSPVMLGQGAILAVIISFNWGIYVWAIAAERTVEAALGYYINPLFSIFLGAVLLGEKLARLQMLAIALAAFAVAVLTWQAGNLPWVSLALTFTWGLYALAKKTLPIGPTQGFFLEVLLLSVPAIGYLLWLAASGQGHFLSGSSYDTGMLALAGFVSAVPLILYANAAKLLRLSTIGIMQYIAPTMIFLIAVFVFGEPFGPARLAAFMLIWMALALYSWSLLKARAAQSER